MGDASRPDEPTPTVPQGRPAVDRKISPSPPGVSRRALVAGGLALGLTPMLPRITGTASADFGFAPPDTTTQVVRPMVFPVDGTVFWVDTFGACRDGCTRHHEGQDLMGTKLQKLIACVTGTVVGFTYDTTGNSLYLQDADGWYYGYLHINNDTPGTDDGTNPPNWAFAPGIALGSKVTQGQLIAYLGDSGNAETTAPHVHYEIRKPSDAWYHAAAVNPKYSLNAATHSATGNVSARYAPWMTASAFVTQQYADFLTRQPSTTELADWTSRLDRNETTPADMVAALLDDPGSADLVAGLIRLHYACFDRPPDTAGLAHWLNQARQGSSADTIAHHLSRTGEFRRRYATATNAQFVDQTHLRLQGRMPSVAGRAYWTDELDHGMPRSRLIRFLADSPHYRYVTHTPVRICVIYAGMLQHTPEPAAHLYWTDQTHNKNQPIQTLITAIQHSPEYANRPLTPLTVPPGTVPPPASLPPAAPPTTIRP